MYEMVHYASVLIITQIHHFLFFLASKEHQWSGKPGVRPQSSSEEQLVVVVFFLFVLFIIVLVVQLPVGEEGTSEDASTDGVESSGEAGEGK